MTWYEEMLMTWLHIAIGIGLLGMILLSMDAMIKWHRSIEEQINEEREINGR